MLREITDTLHAGKLDEGFDLIQNNGMTYEGGTYDEALKKLTDNVVAERKAGETSMVIALLHRHGAEITEKIRAKLKSEGIIGLEDHQVKRLQAVDMSDAQRGDHVNFKVGMVVQPHAILPGGLRPGQQWSVSRVENGQVFVERAGREVLLSLAHAKHFQLYAVETMPLAIGDVVRMTHNDRKYDITTGQIETIKAIDGGYITLVDGKKLGLSKPLHIAQGYTMTGETSQGDEERSVHLFAPAEASPKIDRTTMLVAGSRPTESFMVYTDCMPVLRACATRTQERDAATYERQSVNGDKQERAINGIEKEPAAVDLHAGARKRTAEDQARIHAAEMEAARQAQQLALEHERGMER